MTEPLDKHLNTVTISYCDSDGEPCHTSTYVFLSSIPIALISDQEQVFEFLRPFIVDEIAGKLDNYEFSIVCNILDTCELPELNVPFVDVQMLRKHNA